MKKCYLVLCILLVTTLTFSQKENNHSDDYLDKAKESYVKGDTEAVFKYLNLAVEQSTDNKMQLYVLLGDTYSEFDLFDEAIVTYNKAIAIGCNVETLSYSLGSAYYFSQRYKEAIKYLEISLKLENKYSGSANNLAWCYSEIGNYPKAIEYFKIAYKLDPNYINNINNLVYAYYLNNELIKAEEFVLKAKEIDSDNSFVYRNLGLIYIQKNNKKTACENYQLALEHHIIERWGEIYIKELREYCSV